jgi:hypothetical protein
VQYQDQSDNPKSNVRSKVPYFILLSVLIFGVIIFALLVNVLPSLSNVFNYVNRTPAPLPTYASITVIEICDILNIGKNDSFCADPRLKDWELSDQNARTLEDMLYRNFPIGQTTHEIILPLLRTLRSQGEKQHKISQELDGRGLKPDGCKLDLQPSGDTCYIIFPGDISVMISFGSNGYALKYRVRGARGGS